MTPMQVFEDIIDDPTMVRLVRDKTKESIWVWMEDPTASGIWAVMDHGAVLAVVWVEDQDVEISDRLREMSRDA